MLNHVTFDWKRTSERGYEVSSAGDNRFSALYAILSDGRTIEMHYQCDVKGYDVGGMQWRKGKGKPSLIPYSDDELWVKYLTLWLEWSLENWHTLSELRLYLIENDIYTLTDKFATTNINQARAIAFILNHTGAISNEP